MNRVFLSLLFIHEINDIISLLYTPVIAFLMIYSFLDIVICVTVGFCRIRPCRDGTGQPIERGWDAGICPFPFVQRLEYKRLPRMVIVGTWGAAL